MAFLAVSDPHAQADSASPTPIERSFSRITLGMDVRELEDAFSLTAIENPGLLPAEQLFLVRDTFAGIHEVLTTFYLGKLFRIAVTYTPGHSQHVPWDTFVEFLRRDYGEGWSFESINGQVAMWDDGETVLVLELKMIQNSPPVYILKLVDNGLYSARQESCPLRRQEA